VGEPSQPGIRTVKHDSRVRELLPCARPVTETVTPSPDSAAELVALRRIQNASTWPEVRRDGAGRGFPWSSD
jgi:hypothetical protein